MASVPVLLLKLTLTPFLVGGASLAARRWGPGGQQAMVRIVVLGPSGI
jgi:hypothetical protein